MNIIFLKHTGEQWEYFHEDQVVHMPNNYSQWIAQIRGWGWIQKMPDAENIQDANGRLVAASPVGLKVAIRAYVAILQTPSETWRANNQELYCELRDFISLATGFPAREVQDYFEDVAMMMKHRTMLFESAIHEANLNYQRRNN